MLRNNPFRNLHTNPYTCYGMGSFAIHPNPPHLSHVPSLLLRRAAVVSLLRRRQRHTTPTHTTTHNLAAPPSSHLSSPTSIYCFIVLLFFKINDSMVI